MMLRVGECTGVLYLELVAEQVSKFLPSSSLEDGCSTKVAPNVVMFVPLGRVLVMLNSGAGRPWPVQVKVVEEVMLTAVYAGCNEISVGGSAEREQLLYTYPPCNFVLE